MDWITSGLSPLYTLGVNIWNLILSFCLGKGLSTPESFSPSAWAYVSNILYPFFQAIAATMLNLFFYIGICRQVGNLRESMTLETGVNILIKVILGNLGINSVMLFSKWVFEITGTTGSVMLSTGEFKGIEQGVLDSVQAMVHMIVGIIFLVVAIVCSATVFITIFSRSIQLYMLAAVGPLAISCIPGGPGIQNAAGAWIKTLLTKSLSIIIIAMFIILVSKFNLTDFFAENFLTDIVLPTRCIQNMFVMMLTAAGVKGADLFLKQTYYPHKVRHHYHWDIVLPDVH